MIPLLSAALALAPPFPRYVDIDKFDTPPYSVNISGENYDTHSWYGLTAPQCLFWGRSTHVLINDNKNHTVLTFSLGNHEQRFDSALQVAWKFSLSFNAATGSSVDLSTVDKFLVDYNTDPTGFGADYWAIYVDDSKGGGASSAYWHLRQGGIYWRRSEFAGNVDWRHVNYLEFRQDFDSYPNPTTYDVTRFYVSLVPGAIGPGTKIDPIDIRR